jgi:hypothetical protein
MNALSRAEHFLEYSARRDGKTRVLTLSDICNLIACQWQNNEQRLYYSGTLLVERLDDRDG